MASGCSSGLSERPSTSIRLLSATCVMSDGGVERRAARQAWKRRNRSTAGPATSRSISTIGPNPRSRNATCPAGVSTVRDGSISPCVTRPVPVECHQRRQRLEQVAERDVHARDDRRIGRRRRADPKDGCRSRTPRRPPGRRSPSRSIRSGRAKRSSSRRGNLGNAATNDLLEHGELGPDVQSFEHATAFAVKRQRSPAEPVGVAGGGDRRRERVCDWCRHCRNVRLAATRTPSRPILSASSNCLISGSLPRAIHS